MGEDTKGVLRVIRLVTGVSSVTSEAGKPGCAVRFCHLLMVLLERYTNITREHKEVVISQSTILFGVNKRMDVDAIALRVLVLEYLLRFGIVQCVLLHLACHGVAVQDRHNQRKGSSRGTEKDRADVTRGIGQVLWTRAMTGQKSRLFPRARKLGARERICVGSSWSVRAYHTC